MKSTKTLCVLVASIIAASSIAFFGSGCKIEYTEEEKEVIEQSQIESIKGTITYVDEDIIPVSSDRDFYFEHITIISDKGVEYKLVSPSPTNYRIGEEVTIPYIPRSKITYNELVELSRRKGYNYQAMQNGSISIDGVIDMRELE